MDGDSSTHFDRQCRAAPFRGAYRLVLDMFFCAIVDFGAMLWLLTYVKRSWAFSYALVALVLYALVFFTLAYFFFMRAPKDVQEYSRANGILFEPLSAGFFTSFLVALLCVCLEVAHVMPSKVSAAFAYNSYLFANGAFGENSNDALYALDESVEKDGSNPIYLSERADLLVRRVRRVRESAAATRLLEEAGGPSVDDCLRTAVSDYTSLMLLEPTVAEWPHGRSAAYALQGGSSLEKALEDALAAVELDGQNGTYCIDYAKRLVDCADGNPGRYGLAREYLDRAATLAEGEDADYYDYYIRALMGMQDAEARASGLSVFVKVITRDYDGEGEIETDEIVTQLGGYLKNNDALTQKAIGAFELALQKRQDNQDLRFAYGCTLLMAGRDQEALECFDKLIDDNPLYFDAYVRRSWARNNLKLYDGAISDMGIMIRHNDNTKYHVYRADILYNKGEYSDAIEEYLYAAENGSNMSAYCYYSLGQSYYCLKDYGTSASYYERAIPEGLPDSYRSSCHRYWGDAEYMLGKGLSDSGDVAEAENRYRTALGHYYDAIESARDDEQRGACNYWAGNAHMKMGEYQDAIDAYERAYSLTGNADYLQYVEWCRSMLAG